MSEAALLTNTRGEPSLGSELRAELDSCDEVDLLCAFVKWHGLRVLETGATPAAGARGRRSGSSRRRTWAPPSASALDRLVREFGAEVKIQYDAQRTRLHAKAWMFRRCTGFDTAYVGSSNLSRAALLDGVEWNVRLSRVEHARTRCDKFRATFDTYWNDPSFETYDPDARRRPAGRRARPTPAAGRRTIASPSRCPAWRCGRSRYQQAMLDALDVERDVHDRTATSSSRPPARARR